MKERGMIFNAEMVLALLSGQKTQTRRPVKPQPELTAGSGFLWNGAVYGAGSDDRETNRNFAHVRCPHGKPGDRIWVRETFQGPLFDFEKMDSYLKDSAPFEKPEFCQYAAGGGPRPEYYDADDNLRYGWRPSLHMPRWASRILLEITDVRVERLNTISDVEARSEGITDGGCLNCGESEPCDCDHPAPDPVDAFARLWMDASICQHITAPRLENSRKPDLIREKLVQLLGDVPRIELFARQSSHGFDVWGNQCEGPAVQLQPGYAVDIAGLSRAFSNAPRAQTDKQGRERVAC